MKLSKTLHFSRIILLVIIMFLCIPVLVHYYLSKLSNDQHNGNYDSNHLQALFDASNPEFSDLKDRIEEMLKIKASVMNELRELEQKRQSLQSLITQDSQKAEELRGEVTRQQTELDRSKVSLEQTKLAQQELWSKSFPELSLPKRLFAVSQQMKDTGGDLPYMINHCYLQTCFDYSRCSISSNFPVYLYDIDDFAFSDIPEFVKTSVSQAFGYNIHTTDDPTIACLYVVLVGEVSFKNESIMQFENWLHALPFWGGDGRNHLILYFKKSLHSPDVSFLPKLNTGKAIIGQSYFIRTEFRSGYDVVIPTLMGIPGGEVWEELQPIVPARRKFLLSFIGEYEGDKDLKVRLSQDIDATQEVSVIKEQLESMKFKSMLDPVDILFSCSISNINGLKSEWWLCDSENSRLSKLKESTFTLIISPSNYDIIVSSAVNIRLYEALKSGAIPVILGDYLNLPFSDFIDWRKAAIILSKARISELQFILRSIPDIDILYMRKQGRYVWENYLSSTQSVIDTTLAVIRQRLGIPPAPVISESSVGIFNFSKTPANSIPVRPEAEPEETLGPLESPSPSPKYLRNYTFHTLFGYELWNQLIDPFHLYPSSPFDPELSSDSKFIGSSHGFRPIGQGMGGSGKEFSEALGGNHPREQFTVVMLTYEREQVLMASLSRLYGLPYLNKVIVIWNSPQPPPDDLKWPEIGVPIVVIKAERNSLNNRFLPYDDIETDAILSTDDDAHLRPDEIIFGFRVWREARDRIVGFPGRFHAWDNSSRAWNYNSNYSCELSMVLTGAAFFHKYYTYQYSYIMPQAIRDKVDEYMNCEDIAMNFLVSHITRKPPIKVTSRWTFRCPGCPMTLSEDETHFNERHKCINFFTQVYGYMPLLNTQFRADSILFKTRIPHDKQKCFKFI